MGSFSSFDLRFRLVSNPVVLVHGFASSFDHGWRQAGWVDLLRDADRQVIPVDLLGHGNAEKPHDPDAYDHIEDGVRAVLPEGQPVDAIGFSLGAKTILRLASEDPSRFDRIVLGGVGANVFADQGGEVIAKAVEEGTSEDDIAGRVFASLAAAPGQDRKALAACMRRAMKALTPEQVAKVDRPVLVVLGDKDFAGPADPLVEALPNAKLVTLRNVDHFATPSDFGFIDAALDFIGASL